MTLLSDSIEIIETDYNKPRSETERLKKEKEWLLNECASLKIYDGKHIYSENQREYLTAITIDRMQQALKE